MLTMNRGGFRIEAGATNERDGSCCVTAEVFHGRHMIRGYYCRIEIPSGGLSQAEREVAEQVARMACEAE